MPGRIFAEVESEEKARRLATAIDELNKFLVRRLPLEEVPKVLRVVKGPSLYAWAWVRVCDRRKRWTKYRGDVGIVRTRGSDELDSTQFSNRKFIYLVPRLIFPSDEDQAVSPPPQRLAPHETLAKEFKDDHIIHNLDAGGDFPLTLTFRGEDYDSCRGLLMVEAEKIAVDAGKGILPSRHELRLIYETGFIPRSIYLEAAEALEARRFVEGTRVIVKKGDFKGLVGIVRDRIDENDECVVDLPSQGLIEPIPIRDLRTEFRYGDRLEVINGNHKGLVGWVVDIDAVTGNVSIVNAEGIRNVMDVSKIIDKVTVCH